MEHGGDLFEADRDGRAVAVKASDQLREFKS